ncbi:N-(5'-phosphoribosyl)anthranilate isomerase [Pacificimonas flava]|uniref:N-(5'-phosphoribosyl)anthranilate isomerase n=2 Tax=Pacificimonas TaxID=1960290 RepID=A0A219B1A2_9SPHN|nr:MULTISPECIES: phosphoribosylanthranilate isomerase [Pacificimonas]MBZ6378279.1 phosphoribosylanthranilate isomerase [Pacificimonas aurantium]OWV32105.1 N-(5'-phosphoribosyl)anthranilate isomerase [Pacificimonas flava]
MTRIKICGVSTPDIVETCRDLRVDHIGFVFAAKSSRAVTPAQAAALAAQAGALSTVGLFVDPRDEEIEAALPAISVIQLHGAEAPARCAEIGARFSRPVWKAIGVGSPADLSGSGAYAQAADLVLYDAKPAPGGPQGGLGVRFDWSLLKDRPPVRDWGLAGGLTPENVGRAIAATRAPLVDISSGVEDAPGQKDKAKIAAFVDRVRRS